MQRARNGNREKERGEGGEGERREMREGGRGGGEGVRRRMKLSECLTCSRMKLLSVLSAHMHRLMVHDVRPQ